VPLLAKAGVPRVRFHHLRHTVATLLLEEGVHPEVVGELLGCSAIGVTVDLYSHVTATMHRQAVDALGRLLGSQDGSQEAGE
jgi:site-specific recombinase XerD